ncbi:MAG: PKD domain-containing protein [Candidatus Helarchaeota archaeon]
MSGNRKKKAFVLISLFIMLIFINGMPNSPVIVNSDKADAPIHIHLSWQNQPNETITITWQTSFSNAGDDVFYDTISRNGTVGDYRYNKTGINFTYSGASGYIHTVELLDLKPGFIYYFVCGGPIGGYSEERSFWTANNESNDIRFVVGGDSRTNVGDREKVSQAMSSFNPLFVMHSGDMVETGTNQGQWDSWFNDLHSNWVSNDNRTIPIIPTIGNHELNSVNYYNQFDLPGNEMWFSYDWGPDVHIIVLSTETDTGGSQKTWLENDLIKHQNYTWKFAIFHQPPFPGSRPSGHAGALSNWVPLFDKYHVDLIFNGHDHVYLRTVPINYSYSVDQGQSYKNGSVYIISGGWGAPLYTPDDHWYNAFKKDPNAYHFCVVDVFKNETLHLQAKDISGTTFDEFWIIKNESLELPHMTVNFTNSNMCNYLPFEVKWESSGLIDHFKFYLDGQFQSYLPNSVKSFWLNSLQQGVHSLVIKAFDSLDNYANDSMYLTYDITPPNSFDNYTGQWFQEDFYIALNATDNLSGILDILYQINGGTIKNLSIDGLPFITQESSNNTLSYWSIDHAHNQEIPHNSIFGIKLDKSIPISIPGHYDTIEIGTNVTLNASLSTDNIGIANYQWTFFDNGSKTLSGEIVHYQFNSIGNFKILLNVSDYSGWWAINSTWINVSDSIPPVADIGNNLTALVNSPVLLNGSGSYDNIMIVEYIWNFGDGSIFITNLSIVSHVYKIPGTFKVTLTVIDEIGNNNSDIIFIFVNDINSNFSRDLSSIFFAIILSCLAVIFISHIIWDKYYHNDYDSENNNKFEKLKKKVIIC